jgi:hypothetical protein
MFDTVRRIRRRQGYSMTTTSTPAKSLSLAQRPASMQDQQRKQDMATAWKSFRGQFPPALKVAPAQPDDNVIANHMEPIVTKTTSFLFNQVLKIEATSETSTPDTAKQDMLDGVWGDDDVKMTTLSKLGINGAVCGEAFLKLIPPQGKMKYPRVVVMDPTIIRIVNQPDDCDTVMAYVIEYPVADDWQKRQIIARVDPDAMSEITGDYDLDDTWTISNYMRKGSMGNWALVGAVEDWPYPFAPIFCCQNLPNPNESWGMPDLTQDLINENKSLNFLLSILLRIAKYHGHPITYASGLAASQIQVGIDDLICLPSPDSKISKLDPMTNFSGLLEIVATIMSNIDEQSRVPAVALGRETSLPRGNMSGVALQLLFQPLIEKTTQKQRLYGRLIREVSRAALVLMGAISVDDHEAYQIDLHWQALLPSDDLQAAQTAVLLQSLGVSQATVFSGIGLNADDEMEKKAAEDAKSLALYNKGQGLPPTTPMPAPAPMLPAQPPQQADPSGTVGAPAVSGAQK